jgi:uncharacterized membrane protein
MSTPQTQPKPVHVPLSDKREIRIVQHSPILYWWPVWAFGFLMALITFLSDTRMAVLPPGSKVVDVVKSADGKPEKIIIDLNKKSTVSLEEAEKRQEQRKEAEEKKTHHAGEDFRVHMADTPYVGTFFACVLVAVIIITNVPLRGMWSIVVIMMVVISMVFFTLLGWWGGIFYFFRDLLHVHINAGGYMFISTVLLAIWLVTIVFFDRQVYMIFTPRQLKVRQEIGGGEIAHDTTGMVVQKHRDDLFRHWLLGLGSGDLMVKTAGANSMEYHFHNVAWVGTKLAQIEEMLREQTVVQAQ